MGRRGESHGLRLECAVREDRPDLQRALSHYRLAAHLHATGRTGGAVVWPRRLRHLEFLVHGIALAPCGNPASAGCVLGWIRGSMAAVQVDHRRPLHPQRHRPDWRLVGVWIHFLIWVIATLTQLTLFSTARTSQRIKTPKCILSTFFIKPSQIINDKPSLMNHWWSINILN